MEALERCFSEGEKRSCCSFRRLGLVPPDCQLNGSQSHNGNKPRVPVRKSLNHINWGRMSLPTFGWHLTLAAVLGCVKKEKLS